MSAAMGAHVSTIARCVASPLPDVSRDATPFTVARVSSAE